MKDDEPTLIYSNSSLFGARNDFPTVGRFAELEEISWRVVDSSKIEARFVNSRSDIIFLLERSHHFGADPSYRSRCVVMALSSDD